LKLKKGMTVERLPPGCKGLEQLWLCRSAFAELKLPQRTRLYTAVVPSNFIYRNEGAGLDLVAPHSEPVGPSRGMSKSRVRQKA
jgi:hypothetical protein